MATSVESPSPASLNKGLMLGFSSSSSPPMFSPSSDKRFWSTLRSRIDTLIENRRPSIDLSLPTQLKAGANEGGKKVDLKEDSLLLLRGFDSVAQSLSQLSNNLEDALQGARDLARPPTLTELVQAAVEKAKTGQNKEENEDENRQDEDNKEQRKKMKRKLGSEECSEDEKEDSEKAKDKSPQEMGKFKRAKNLAISMATKAATLVRELKSIRSDLSFVQERCGLLEEENKRLRDGIAKGITPDEDDLVRLQLEALLAEKSRLASENANLTRENQCLHQLVEYHQLTSQDLSSSYENLIRGMGIDFSSPGEMADDECQDGIMKTPQVEDMFGVCKSLDECYGEEEEVIG